MMKRLFVLLLSCLILCGCAPQASGTEPVPASSDEVRTADPLPEGIYDPEDPMEAATDGAVKTYCLSGRKPTGIFSSEDGLFLTADSPEGTLLLKLSGQDGYITQSYAPDFPFFPGEDSSQFFDGGIAVTDTGNRELLTLDSRLRELSRISLPEELTGTAFLSPDSRKLYYAAPDTIRVLELDTGISRVLKEIPGGHKSIAGLHFSGSVLSCRIWEENGRERTLFLSAEDGSLLLDAEGRILLETAGERYFAVALRDGCRQYLFGIRGGETRMLNHTGSLCRFFPSENTALSAVASGGRIQLDYYDLATGQVISRVTLPEASLPTAMAAAGETVWFLREGSSPLYCWDTDATAVQENTCHTAPFHPPSQPDQEGLALCRQYAAELSEKFGLELRISPGEDFPLPQGYTAEEEYLVPPLLQYLTTLEQQLGNYPPAFFNTLSGHFSGIRIAVVRSICDSEGASLSALQFWEGSTACILLTAAPESTALYRELCRLTETVVLTKSNAYDRWEKLNPKNFRYLQDATATIPEEYQAYLQPGSQVFPDECAMRSPQEDRAGIMEWAMSPGREEDFRSLAMQSKLLQLCTGIRSAFGWKKSPEVFVWEQYLNAPLAYIP